MLFFHWLARFFITRFRFLSLRRLGFEENLSISIESNELLMHEDNVNSISSSASCFNILGHDVTRNIFEHLIDDFASIRLVCKRFRRAFDDFNLAICSNIFPVFTKATFSHWNDDDLTKRYLKYQLILLTHAFIFNSKIISFEYEESDIQLDLMTTFHLRRNATKLIMLFKSKIVGLCLKLLTHF